LEHTLTKTLLNKAGRPKSVQKRKQILLAAGELFLDQGFSGCSMDMVAKKSGVSKQTVYSHFNNKEALFTAVIDAKCEDYQLNSSHLEHESGRFEDVLQKSGLQIIRLLHDSQVIALYRVVMGEVSSNPRVAELFYQAGPQHSLGLLAQCFQRSTQGKLTEQQAMRAAVMFFNLLKGEFHTKSILGLDFALNPQQQLEQVTAAIDALQYFLKSQVT
jgi:TetR/AcrR family transcriptional regulator, mexJK operon transcriptional repressor